MKILYTEILCVESLLHPNTWFLFRPNGIEVTIVINGNNIKSNKELSENEVDYLKHNFL